MPQRKPYNPNTSYGRKKLREEAARYRESLSPEERKEHDTNLAVWTIIIVGIFLLILYLVGGGHAVQRWMQR